MPINRRHAEIEGLVAPVHAKLERLQRELQDLAQPEPVEPTGCLDGLERELGVFAFGVWEGYALTRTVTGSVFGGAVAVAADRYRARH